MNRFKRTLIAATVTLLLCSFSFGCAKSPEPIGSESGLTSPSDEQSQVSGNEKNSLSDSVTSDDSSSQSLTSSANSQSLWDSKTQSNSGQSSSAQKKLPSDILDLTNWKITLPVKDEATGKALEIRQPTLNSYFNEDYFTINAQRDGVIFTAPVEGFTTTGSSYPRSELREMTENGGKNASWQTTSGTHIMTVTQAVTHTPDYKKHVVAGQIHDDSDDVITFRLEDKKLFIDLNGKDGPTLDKNYVLGTKFTVKFVAGNNGVMCYYNGKHVYTHSVNASGCFFKAGVYTQSNLSKGDKAGAYGQTVVYSLCVEHYSTAPEAPSYYED
ncbi:MAG: polysaccharide lyase family 7 protein [Christensenellaceae bacterium]